MGQNLGACLVADFSTLEVTLRARDFANVKTLTVDEQQRIRMPDAKPRQVFAYENHGDGHVTLTLMSAATEEPFPKGSLRKYVSAETNAELSALARGGINSPTA